MRVQIPLWTIVTLPSSQARMVIRVSSDSSMDDCNKAGGYRATFRQLGSDSSMDDCNVDGSSQVLNAFDVQIPLWTIVTEVQKYQAHNIVRSDSSMDDCNAAFRAPTTHSPLFRFLYGRL